LRQRLLEGSANTSQDVSILASLEYLIQNKVKILSKYGVYAYLKEEGDIYFLCDDSTVTSFSDSIYTSQQR
jgi:hypothetical protein